MKRLLIFVGILLAVVFSFVNAQASIVLYADPSTYVAANSDPWFTDSYITGPGDFTLTVKNSFTQNAVNDIYLVIAMKESTKDGLSITLNGNTLNASNFTASGSHPYITDSHGVLGNSTYYYNYFIGDLASLESTDLDISIVTSGSPIVHFDAYGYKVKNNDGDLQLINNPNSKDVTWDPPLYNELNPPVVPEPATLSFFGIMLFGLVGFNRRFYKG